MATRSLNVVISGDARQIGVASREAVGHISLVERASHRMGDAIKLGFGAMAVGAGVGLTVLKKSADAAKEAEASQARLKAQLNASGISYRAHAKEIDKVIQKHSQLAGIDDEDLQDAFTNLVRSTGSVSKAMHDMGLVTDIARAKHIDVTKAADLLGKVHAGNVGILKRYGIALDPVTKAQDKLKESNKNATVEQVRAAKAADKQATSQKALAELQKRFGGQAEAYGKTAAGAQERFGVALENVEEKLGKVMLPVLAKVANGVAHFLVGIDQGTGAGGKFAAAIKTGFETARNAVATAVAAIRGYLSRHRADIESVEKNVKQFASGVRDAFEHVALPVVKRVVAAIGPILDGLYHTIRGIVRLVSGLLSGDWSKAWSGAKEAVGGAFKAIVTTIKTDVGSVVDIVKGLGPKLVRLIISGLANLGKALATGIFEGIKAAVKAVPGMAAGALKGLGHAITSAISGGLGKLNPFGDGLGAPSFPSTAFSGGNSLMGARSSMAPVAGLAARFGLHTSSGLRPGAITSSGNVSYHSSGEALDEAGSPAGMMGFFRYMKGTMGPRLAELIYGPGKIGIKDGRPFDFGPALNAQHMDHVHVAIDTGIPGVGDGLGRFVATSYGPPWGGIQGTGTTATGVNLHGNPHIYGVAVDPSVIPLGSKLKITPNPFNYSGAFTAFDTGGAIKGNRIDFYDWRGRQAQYGWGSRTVTVSTVTGSGGSSKGGRSKAPKITHGRGAPVPTGSSSHDGDTSDINPLILNPYQKGQTLRPLKGISPEEAQAYAQAQSAASSGTTDTTDYAKEMVQAIKDLKASIDANTNFAKSVAGTDAFQATKALTDIVSGQLGGYGIVGRSFTPGRGVEHVY